MAPSRPPPATASSPGIGVKTAPSVRRLKPIIFASVDCHHGVSSSCFGGGLSSTGGNCCGPLPGPRSSATGTKYGLLSSKRGGHIVLKFSNLSSALLKVSRDLLNGVLVSIKRVLCSSRCRLASTPVARSAILPPSMDPPILPRSPPIKAPGTAPTPPKRLPIAPPAIAPAFMPPRPPRSPPAAPTPAWRLV